MSSACKADTVAAAVQPTLFHQPAALDPRPPESPLSLPDPRAACSASAMDAGRSRSIPSAEQDQPPAPNVPAFTPEDSSRLTQEVHRSYLDYHRRDMEELDRVVQRASRLQHAEEQDKKLDAKPPEEAVEVELAKYVSQEDEFKWRCKVPECSKLFKGRSLWRKHVDNRHLEWREQVEADTLSQRSQMLAVQPAPTLPCGQADITNQTTSHSPVTRTSTSFLSLPPYIRTRIYGYLLTNPDSQSTVVHIKRQLQLPCYKLTRPLAPTLSYTLSPQPTSPFTTSILLTNKTIYSEALPVLYADKVFYLHDLEGLLLLFLDKLSESSRSSIKSIRLPSEPLGSGVLNKRKARAFHWAITCAQIAKLNDTLKTLEICGEEILDPGASKQYILHPLCKIKAKKQLVHSDTVSPKAANYADRLFAELLRQAEDFLKSNAKVREEKTKAEAKERAERVAREKKERELEMIRLELERKAEEDMETLLESAESMGKRMGVEQLAAGLKSRMDGINAESSESVQAIAARIHQLERPSMPQWMAWPKVTVGEIDQDLAKVKGLDQFQKELAALEELEAEGYEVVGRLTDSPAGDGDILEEWDMVSVRSGKPPTKENGYGSDDEWQDTASTLVGNDHDDDESHDKKV